MFDASHLNLAKAFGKALTEAAAPEELEFYDELVENIATKSTVQDRALGFGVPIDQIPTISNIMFELSQHIVASVWASAGLVAAGVMTNAAKELEEQLDTKISNWIKARFQTKAPFKLPEVDISSILAEASRVSDQNHLTQSEKDSVLGAVRVAIS